MHVPCVWGTSYFVPSILAGFLPVGSVAAQGIVSTVYLTLWLIFQVRLLTR